MARCEVVLSKRDLMGTVSRPRKSRTPYQIATSRWSSIGARSTEYLFWIHPHAVDVNEVEHVVVSNLKYWIATDETVAEAVSSTPVRTPSGSGSECPTKPFVT
jgi:hypothetical protein